MLSCCLERVDLPAGQVTLHSHLPNGQGLSQSICQLNKIKVLCEQTREANKRIKMSFGLCLILFGFGNIVADFHVLFRVRGN